MRKSILVTGGAGYIGSHIVHQLAQAGEQIVILDNLSTGYAESVLAGELIVGDCGDRELVSQILRKYNIEAVIHLAASIIVPESIKEPLKYYQNNTINTCNLLDCCIKANIPHFIFSSSASVYGMQAQNKVTETAVCNPINPYGRSKLFSEWMLKDLSAASSLRYVALRYFNVGGAEMQGRLGLRNPAATTLIKVAVQAALEKRPFVAIYGTDYPTNDGTGVRDYIHVEDIAGAHLKALEYLRSNNPSTLVNCGYGRGYSVRQVLESVQRLAKTTLKIQEYPRRAGDPAEIIADNQKILTTLKWQPKYADIDIIIQSSLNWEKQLAGLA